MCARLWQRYPIVRKRLCWRVGVKRVLRVCSSMFMCLLLHLHLDLDLDALPIPW